MVSFLALTLMAQVHAPEPAIYSYHAVYLKRMSRDADNPQFEVEKRSVPWLWKAMEKQLQDAGMKIAPAPGPGVLTLSFESETTGNSYSVSGKRTDFYRSIVALKATVPCVTADTKIPCTATLWRGEAISMYPNKLGRGEYGLSSEIVDVVAQFCASLHDSRKLAAHRQRP